MGDERKAPPWSPGLLAVEFHRGLTRTRRGLVVRWIYFLECDGLIKIGCSQDPQRRQYRLNTGNPKAIQWLGAVPGSRRDEAALHRRFRHVRVRGEWFRPDEELRAVIGVSLSVGAIPPLEGAEG